MVWDLPGEYTQYFCYGVEAPGEFTTGHFIIWEKIGEISQAQPSPEQLVWPIFEVLQNLCVMRVMILTKIANKSITDISISHLFTYLSSIRQI